MNSTGTHTISLDATEFPWGAQGLEDSVQYKVGSTSTLVCLYGGMSVAGTTSISTSLDSWGEWRNIGTGANYEVASATINIPQGHNGIVMFTTKGRIQCDKSDAGGTVQLWLNIDGAKKGSTGIQQITAPNGESQRTLCASYLAAGTNALTPGTHTVKVYARADGPFLHPCLSKDLPLIWFD